MTRITYAAIRYPDGEIATARRHYQIIYLQGILGRFSRDCEQGFLDSEGNFLTREQAKEVALESGQISPDHQGTLFSEDLWPEQEPIEM